LGTVCASVEGAVTAIANAVMAAAMVSLVMCLVMRFSYVILSQRAVVSCDAIMKISFGVAPVDRTSLSLVIPVRKIPNSGFGVRRPRRLVVTTRPTETSGVRSCFCGNVA
jgi:hypothetical protein